LAIDKERMPEISAHLREDVVNIVKRVFLFIALNFLIMISMSVIMAVFGVQPYLQQSGLDYGSLAIFCLLWGFTGSFISLLMSKQMAKWSYHLQMIDENTREPQLRELLNIVKDLSSRAGIDKMPEVAVYQSDDINAFATGPSKNNALVAVSTGLLGYMNRNEIEAVLGHEISHVSNGDMVTMTLLQGVVNAFSMFLARAVAFAVTRDRSGQGGNSMSYILVRVVLDVVFMLLGSILVSAFSRHREYRADYGGAKLAGQDNMKQALMKLRSQFERIQPVSGTASTLMISNKPSGLMDRLFSTHPPLDDRIARLSKAEIK